MIRNIGKTVKALLETNAHTATKVVTPHFVIRVTRKMNSKGQRYATRTEDLVITYGNPNYATRIYITKLRQAGEPFPVRRIFYTFKRKK